MLADCVLLVHRHLPAGVIVIMQTKPSDMYFAKQYMLILADKSVCIFVCHFSFILRKEIWLYTFVQRKKSGFLLVEI